MCGRRKQKNAKKKQKLSKKTQTKLKKKKRKRKCCLRIWSSICRWCCRRIGRCMRKKVIGAFGPRWSDYEFNDVDVRSLKNKLPSIRKRPSLRKTSTIVTLYKNDKPFSKTNISLKHFRLIEGLEASDLRTKLSMTKSKETLLEQFIDDYKKGNLSSYDISNKINPKKLNKDQLNKLLETYKHKKLSNKHKSLKNMNFDDVRKRFSIRESKEKDFDKLIADYQKGNVSKSALFKIRKLDLNKEKLSERMRKLKKHQKNKKSFPSLSKLNEYSSLSHLKTVFGNMMQK